VTSGRVAFASASVGDVHHRLSSFRGLQRSALLLRGTAIARLFAPSPSALACPAVEPNTRAGLFCLLTSVYFGLSRTLGLPPFSSVNSTPAASRASRIAIIVRRWSLSPFSRRNTVSGLTTALAASSGTPIPRAARAILHCVASKFAGAIHIPGGSSTIRDHAGGAPDTQAALTLGHPAVCVRRPHLDTAASRRAVLSAWRKIVSQGDGVKTPHRWLNWGRVSVCPREALTRPHGSRKPIMRRPGRGHLP
jgi:hypothetical protein